MSNFPPNIPKQFDLFLLEVFINTMEKKEIGENKFITPNRPMPHKNCCDSENELKTSVSFDDQNTTPPVRNVHNTPAIIKLRKATQEFHIHSPSDNMLSPCTQKLFANQLRGNKKSTSHPLNILKMKHQQMFPSNKNNNQSNDFE